MFDANTVTLEEWALIRRGTNDAPSGTISERTLPSDDFDWLLNSELCGETDVRVFNIIGRDTLQVANLVGVVETPSGTALEILPKIFDDEDDPVRARRLLCRLVAESIGVPPVEADEASLELGRLPFQEWVAARFMKEVTLLLRRGLRFGYTEVEAREAFLRGRLQFARQLRQGPGRDHLFNISYEIFSPDRPENRLIKRAVEVVSRRTVSAETKRLAELALEMTESIPASRDTPMDFASWQNTRLTADYRHVRPWCRLILREEMPRTSAGEWRGLSMLFPMEKLFEEAVGRRLRVAVRSGVRISEQHQGTHLCRQGNRRLFGLRPDFVLDERGTRWIADAKWKEIQCTLCSYNGCFQSPYGISQADLYQMFAYGHKYLHGSGLMLLIYPKTKAFDRALDIFEYSENLRLAVVPVDLEKPLSRAFEHEPSEFPWRERTLKSAF